MAVMITEESLGWVLTLFTGSLLLLLFHCEQG